MQAKGKIDKLIEGITLVFVGAVMLLILLGAFGKGGAVLSNVLIGSLGYAVYGYAAAMLVAGVLLLFNFKYYKRVAVLLGAVVVFASIISIFHTLASQGGNIGGYGSYIESCYNNRNTCGGALGAIFLYPLIKLSYVFTIVLFSITAISGVLFGTLAEIKRNKGTTYRFNNKKKTVKSDIAQKTPIGNLIDLGQLNSTVSTAPTAINIDNRYVKPRASGESYNVSTLDETFTRKQNERNRQEFAASEMNVSPNAPSIVKDTEHAINVLYNSGEIVGEKEERELTVDEAKGILYSPIERDVVTSKSPKKKSVKETIIDIDNYTINGRTRIIKENMVSRGEIIVAHEDGNLADSESQQGSNQLTHSGTILNSFQTDNSSDIGYNGVNDSMKPINIDTNEVFTDGRRDNSYNAAPKLTNIVNDNIISRSESNDSIESQPATIAGGKYDYLNDNVTDMSASNQEPLESFESVIRHNAQVKKYEKKVARDTEAEEYRARLERKRRERSDKGGEHVSSRSDENMVDNTRELFGQLGGGVNLNIQPAMPNKSGASNDACQENVLPQAKLARQSDEPYKAPPISLLSSKFDNPPSEVEDFSGRVRMLEETLESFRLPAKVNNIVRGPSFSRMELAMPPGISVDRVKQFTNDIAMCLETTSVNLQIPIPGKKAFGVELPNKIVTPVGIKSIINSPQFNSSRAAVICALGKDIEGNIHVVDLATMPHLLVAGSTGSGKSVCLNSMLVSILYHHTPEEVRIALVDPKQVEFSAFNKLPHLLLPQSIYEKEHVINLLDYLVSEMEARYSLLDSVNLKKISEYNVYAAQNNKEKMYYIVAVLDEVGDLMNLFKKELEDRIQRLAAKARAAGIILVLATQRPSVNVITGVIKANLPSRIAFATTSSVDSRTILDQGGANNLLGKGDMLFMHNGGSKIQRIQGAFIDTDEVNAVCDYVRENNTAYYDPEITELVFRTKKVANDNSTDALGNSCGDPDIDSTFVKCLLTCIEQDFASISLLQRKYKIGYNRASIYFYKMEEMGYISTEVVNNRRSVLLTQEEFNIIYGDFHLE